MKKLYVFMLLGALGIFASCKEYLDARPDQSLATIETVKDMQALLDFFNTMNSNDPGTANACADDSYVTADVFNARDEYDRNLYLWQPAHVFKPLSNAWKSAYDVIYVCNAVLDAAKAKEDDIADREGLNYVRAQALFHRSRMFLNIVGVWAMPYDKATASNTLGIPLRLDADFNKVSKRASLEESFRQIVTDLKAALPHLKAQDISPVRASKAGAYGYLSRTYLQMRDYENAGLYADSALQIAKTLMNYNTLSTTANFPILRHNVEVLFDGRAPAPGTASQARALVNPELYNLYDANDLRKLIFYRASGSAYIFKGYYAGAALIFTGIATGELLLNRAESYTRAGRLEEAMADINYLLLNRYKTGAFVPLNSLTKAELLTVVKKERRKELAFRTLRWNDIKRWNLEGDDLVLSRTINGETTVLQPNSLRYALAIPEDVIERSGLQQNPR
ncbi:SusD family protein [compost metagenome]